MFSKRQKWIPYPSLKTIFRLSLLWTRDIRMDRNPSARENGGKTAPNYIPDRATMRKVSARVRLE